MILLCICITWSSIFNKITQKFNCLTTCKKIQEKPYLTVNSVVAELYDSCTINITQHKFTQTFIYLNIYTQISRILVDRFFKKISGIVEESIVYRPEKFQIKSIDWKKYQGQIFKNFVRGHSLPGVAKFLKLLRWIDRGSLRLFNGEKILVLRRTQLDTNGIKVWPN